MVKKKIVAIVQARSNSIRLPGKILKSINGVPAIELLLKRLKKAKFLDQIVIATSNQKKNMKFRNFLKKKKIEYYAGSENNVLLRYFETATKYKADIIVRITGDSIIIDPTLIDNFIKIFKKKKIDYLSNTHPATFPDGLDIEIFDFKTLKKTNNEAKNLFDREHVTTFIKDSKKFKRYNIEFKENLSKLRWSLDEEIDLKEIKLIYDYFKPNIYFSWLDVLKVIKKNKKKFTSNSFIKRNEGAKMSKTKKMWRRAKQIIPGGNMLLSKRPELFHPKLWPAYFDKARGCQVWDLDGKKYNDISLMGVGSNILGYANPEVDNAVKKAINKSNISSLNCPEEVELCEKLIEMHPWADMARLARTGGEASAISIRIARAATGKSKIAFCGYHGWHDWYLSANIKNSENLKSYLLPGLEPNGVPRELKGTAIPFEYNNFEQLKRIVENNDIGAIKMEVSRNQKPKNNFLQKIRILCNKKKIILMFDECSSGFRQTFGGLHKVYGVNPDMAWFGKALGNGYGITAIIGKREIMDCAQNSFISSTFWTERSGPVAANKTLEIMEKTKSWDLITKIGENIQKKWKILAARNKLNISVTGIPALSSFNIISEDWLKYKTYITQEMLKKNFLATNAIFVSVKHDKKILDRYFDILDKIFKDLSDFENKVKQIDNNLDGPVCHTKFERLN
tara:strand:+ start:2130 stop:4169 length:2040 start_codon:yes stop_codon:yes gene_type:complete